MADIRVPAEVPAPAAGVLADIAAKDGETVAVGALLGQIKEGAAAPGKTSPAPKGQPDQKTDTSAPINAATEEPRPRPQTTAKPADVAPLAPSVRRMAAESDIDVSTVPGSGKDGRVTKGDMMAAIERAASAPTPVAQRAAAVQPRAPSPADDAAQDLFERKHGVKLGFMGFFVRACVQALKEIPAVNAEIDGGDIVYKNYYHIGVAVGTEKGLVVPVVRECDKKSLAQIEQEIADLGRRARDGTLKIEEMQGGTFTISNGGVYGSLMSTPILNAPQSGILGMHKIEDRPVVVAGKIEIRPMMYLALSYDHRLVDGREAVTFLVRVKEILEDPTRLTCPGAPPRRDKEDVTHHALRPHCHRLRAGRLCLRDPRSAARHESCGDREG